MDFPKKEGTLDCLIQPARTEPFCSTIARAIHICCHNGWHLLIMSIISLFNAFIRVADMKQMVNLQAYSKHNTLLQSSAVGGRPLYLNTLEAEEA